MTAAYSALDLHSAKSVPLVTAPVMFLEHSGTLFHAAGYNEVALMSQGSKTFRQ